jgi:hypothetical protein
MKVSTVFDATESAVSISNDPKEIDGKYRHWRKRVFYRVCLFLFLPGKYFNGIALYGARTEL